MHSDCIKYRAAVCVTEWNDVLSHIWCSKPVFVVGQSTCAAGILHNQCCDSVVNCYLSTH